MLCNMCKIFILFMIYSIIGYFVEVTFSAIESKKISFNRGFLIGPYIPIFGVGAILITLFLTKYQNDILVLFVVGTVVCAILEYITSLIMEKLFKLRWWDYSNYKFNINGRVCLETAALFGVGAVIIVEILNPFFIECISKIPNYLIIIIGIILMTIFIIDLTITTFIMYRIKFNVSKYINKDATEAIKEEVKKSLRKYIYLVTRILNAFPNIQYIADSKRLKSIPDFKQIAQNRFKAFKELIFKTKQEMKKLKEKNKKN